MGEVDQAEPTTSAAAERGNPRTLYEILQVSPKADDSILQAAYRTLARTFHPDLNPDAAATARMREINEAYDLLKDPRKRVLYDLSLRQQSKTEIGPQSTSENLRRWTQGTKKLSTCWRCADQLNPFSPYCSTCH